MAAHGAKHLAAAVLKRNINVFDHFFFLCKHVKQLFCYSFRIGIKKAHPFYAVNSAYCAQKLRQHALSVNIHAITGGILCYYYKFLYSLFGKLAALRKNFIHRAAAVAPAYHGNCAIGTAIVAAVCYADICIVGVVDQNTVAFRNKVFGGIETGYFFARQSGSDG